MEQELKSTGSRGGFRHGSGRKRGEGSTTVRVPNGLLHEVQALIKSYQSEHTPCGTELAKGDGASGSGAVQLWQKRLATLESAPSRIRQLAIKDFGSLEQAAKKYQAYDPRSNRLVTRCV